MSKHGGRIQMSELSKKDQKAVMDLIAFKHKLKKATQSGTVDVRRKYE